MDRASFRRKVFFDLFVSPWTLLPTAGGMSLLLASWALGQGPEMLTFLGVMGLLGGLGAGVTRWILQFDQVSQRVYESWLKKQRQEQEQQLDDLDRRLRQDRDPRPEKCLADLRAMYLSFHQDAGFARKVGSKTALEIGEQVEKLFHSCVASLERTYELWKTGSQLRTESARRTVHDERERTVAEIQASTLQLAKTLDEIRTLSVQRAQEGSQLAQIRQELKQSLDVARRVEERMQNLEGELQGHVRQAQHET